MAGFDWGDTQKCYMLMGGKIEVGTFDISSGSTTVDVPTNLARISFGMAHACLTTTTDTQQTMFAGWVGDVSNGAVTFQRWGGFNEEDARMAYVIAGY